MEIVDLLHRKLEDDAVIVSGMNQVSYWANIGLPIGPRRTFITPGFFGTLGFEFPTALGAKVGAGKRRVVSICGDGGFLFADAELATAVQYKLDILVLLFNNDLFGASAWDQQELYGGHFLGTQLHNPDFVKLAEAFGATGLRCSYEQLGPMLDRALELRGPVVLEVRVPNAPPPWFCGLFAPKT
jgi:acetolactate synthase-1/2/3 large subunit